MIGVKIEGIQVEEIGFGHHVVASTSGVVPDDPFEISKECQGSEIGLQRPWGK